MAIKTRNESLGLRTFLKLYRWRKVDPVPHAKLTKPISKCRVALISSAGLVVPGDEPFDHSIRGGDFSHRTIPFSADVATLEEHHRSQSFDHSGIEADRNSALPLDRIHELADLGVIGEPAPRHISLMGSITAPGRLLKFTAPRVADMLTHDEVDIALLVPV